MRFSFLYLQLILTENMHKQILNEYIFYYYKKTLWLPWQQHSVGPDSAHIWYIWIPRVPDVGRI